MTTKNVKSKSVTALPDSLFANVQEYDPTTRTSKTKDRVLLQRYHTDKCEGLLYKGFNKETNTSITLFLPLF